MKFALTIVVVGLFVAACSGDAPAIEPQGSDARESPTTNLAATAETPTATPVLTTSPTPTPASTPTVTPVLTTPPTPTPAQTPTVTTDGDETESELSLLVYYGGPYVTSVYDREEWSHWIDEDGDCQDTRQEVLIEESVGLVSYTDSRQCRVASGVLTGPYTGEEFTDLGELDIDHMVPLAEAHSSGGWTWSEAKKLQSSLAVGGELPEDGLAAYGDEGDDLMMDLARKIVSGDDEDEAQTVEEVFSQARDAEAAAEELLVDDGWKLVEVEPEAVAVNSLPCMSSSTSTIMLCASRSTATGPTATGTTTTHWSRSRRGSPGPSSWPRSRSSRSAGTEGPSPRACPCSSGRWSLNRSGRRLEPGVSPQDTVGRAPNVALPTTQP